MNIAFPLAVLLGAPLSPSGDPAAKDRQTLAGTWVIESATWCGRPIPLSRKDGKSDEPITWKFEGDEFNAWVGGTEPENGSFRLDAGQSPKHLDLTPPKDSEIGPCKCLYALSEDKLTIAMSLWFAPGTPQDEAEQAAKMRATRPATLGGKRDDLILTLTFKRQKK